MRLVLVGLMVMAGCATAPNGPAPPPPTQLVLPPPSTAPVTTPDKFFPSTETVLSADLSPKSLELMYELLHGYSGAAAWPRHGDPMGCVDPLQKVPMFVPQDDHEPPAEQNK